MAGRIFVLVFLCIVLCCGCSLHYQNQKGVKANGKDFQTKIGTIEKGKAHFWSEVDLWIPFRPKITKK